MKRTTEKRHISAVPWGLIEAILGLLFSFALVACGSTSTPEVSPAKNMTAVPASSPTAAESTHGHETPESFQIDDMEANNKMYIQVGGTTLTAVLTDNETASALRTLLENGPLTISASNYGGFEKVCDLGTELPRNDIQTTTEPGDICLYNGDQIVIFYGSNTWSYTELGKISDTTQSELENILSGSDSQITLSLSSTS